MDVPLRNLGLAAFFIVFSVVAAPIKNTQTVSASVANSILINAPDKVSVFNRGHRLSLKWSADKAIVSSHRIYKSENGGPFSLYAWIDAGTSFVDNSVVHGRTYQYFVTEVANGIESAPSNTVSVNP